MPIHLRLRRSLMAMRVGLADVDADESVEVVFGQIADAGGEGSLACIAVAIAGDAVGGLAGDAGEIAAQDDVDHAGDGVRAVDGRGAVLQHFDAFHRIHRDDAEVGEDFLAVVGQTVAARCGGHSTAPASKKRPDRARRCLRHRRRNPYRRIWEWSRRRRRSRSAETRRWSLCRCGRSARARSPARAMRFPAACAGMLEPVTSMRSRVVASCSVSVSCANASGDAKIKAMPAGSDARRSVL